MCRRLFTAPIVLVLGLLFASQTLGITPRPTKPAMIKLAPEQCVLFFHSFGFTTPESGSSNKTEQLFADPDMRRLIDEVMKLGDAAVEMGIKKNEDQQEADRARKAYDLAKFLIARPVTVYLSEIDPKAETIDAGIVVDAGERVEEVKSLLVDLQSESENEATVEEISGFKCYRLQDSEDDPPFYWSVRGTTVIATVGENSIHGLFERVSTPPPAWLRAVVQRLPVKRRSLISYFNIKEVTRMIRESDDPKAAQGVSGLGLDGIDSVSFVAGLGDQGFESQALIACSELKGLMSVMDNEGLSLDDLATVPGNAKFAGIAQFDVAKLFDAIQSFVEGMDPEAGQQMQAGMAQASGMMGFDIRNDLINSLGDRWMVYQSGMGMMMVPELVVTVNLRDRATFDGALTKLIGFAQQAMSAQQNAPQVSIAETDLAGNKAYYLQGLPIVPTWCIADDRLMISTSSGSLKTYLTSEVSPESSLGANERIAALFSDGPSPSAVGFSDLKSNLEMAYPMMQMMLNMGIGQMKQETGLDFDLTALPPIKSITKHLDPSIFSMRRTPDGIEFTASETLPQVSVSAGGAPVIVALLLPAVQAAREAARRTQSMNNLRMLALGTLNYESAQQAFPPASKNGLSWRVHILPFLEEQALYDSFHLDEPWDSEHNKKLISKMPAVYASPASPRPATEGKTNYLAVSSIDSIITGEEKGIGIEEIRDGTSKTILLLEVDDDRAAIWTKPEDFVYDEAAPANGVGSLHAGKIFLAVFADGSVEAISTTVESSTLNAMYTRSGEEAYEYVAP